MEGLLILSIIIAPVAIIFTYVNVRDRWEKEPAKLLWFLLIMGGIGIIPAAVIELLMTGMETGITTLGQAAFMAFCVAGFVEEVTKIFLLKFLTFRESNFNEEFDGIVYGVVLCLGFALFENVMYVIQSTSVEGGAISTAIARAFTAVPMHASTGIILGYHLGLAKFNPKFQFGLLFKGFLIATILHGIYDFCIFSTMAVDVQFAGFGFVGAILTLFVMWGYTWVLIKRAQVLTTRRHESGEFVPSTHQPHVRSPKKTTIQFCSSCGSRLTEGSNFCNKCGAKL